jgi:TPR repeat protein
MLKNLLLLALLAIAGAAAYLWISGPKTGSSALAQARMAELRQAAESGDADAEFVLATMYRNGAGVERNPNKAFALARQSADQGNAEGQTLVAMLYQSGEGTSRDLALAARYFERAADQGEPWAQSILGGIYMSGDGVEQNNRAAIKWLSLAAEGGSAGAKSFLDAVEPGFTEGELSDGRREAQEVRDRTTAARQE